MKKIPLTQGKFALIDDEDFEHLSQWKWSALLRRDSHGDCWYAIRFAKVNEVADSKGILMHRVIAKAIKGTLVDHKNGNGLDNRRRNLRKVTTQQNAMNTKRTRKNTSGHVGVYWNSKRQCWNAHIAPNGKKIVLGEFSNVNDAISERKKAETKYFGEFART